MLFTVAGVWAGETHDDTVSGDLNKVRTLAKANLKLLQMRDSDGNTALHKAEEEEGFNPLFDGKTLNGWDGDPRLWSVEDGAIVGSTDSVSIQRNTFLIYTAKQFGDFIFRAQVKLRNHNSGIQFRSEALPE